MTTYSYIQYDIFKNVMYLKETPTPGLKDLLDSSSTSDPLVRDILLNLNQTGLDALDTETTDILKNFLDVTPEINLEEALYVTFTIEIIDDIEVGDVSLVATNLDETKTYVTKGGAALTPIIDAIKPESKYPTLGKCRDCFKFTFGKDNVFNFTGNIGGYSWTGNYKNGQKEYQFSMPDFSSPTSLPTPYTIFWRPNITANVTLYGGATLSISNKNKWIAVPTANIGTANELNNQAFFHYLSGTEAPCPYASNPTNPNWNFQGNKGFFLLENVNPVFTPFQSNSNECPTFKPSPGNIDWGWNCGPDGNCVAAPSGSIGTYVSYSICIENCTGTGNYGWNCTSNGCVEGTITNTGSYATLQECLDTECGSPNSGSDLPTTCPCDPLTNIITNPGFDAGISGYSNWAITPTTFTPGVGNWITGQGYAEAAVAAQLNSDNTSSVSLTKYELFTPSCSYEVCFQAWQADPSVDSFITLGFGQPLPISSTYLIQNLTATPTAYSFTITAGSPNLTFYLGTALGSNARISIDNVCVTLIECPPESSGSIDCLITGSSYCYTDVEYDCLCPEGYIANGLGQCIESGSIVLPKIITGTPYAAPAVSSPAWGWGRPVLYYNYDVTGSTFSSTLPGNQSPLFGDPTVFNTQFTFDILSASFWRAGGPNNLANTHMRDSQLSATWVGGGSFIEVTGSLDKTVYAALIGDDVFRLKVDGTPKVTINSSVALQSMNGTQLSARSMTLNPYIPYNLNNVLTNYTYNCWHIYPIELKPGCHSITLEGRDQDGVVSGFAGFIFDNTATEIAHANSLSDLNIFWDSSVDLLYDFDNSPVTASCPTGSTPLGPDPCDLCITTGSIFDCGLCINCANGILYNGYTVDKGGYTFQGRGPGGIINTNVVDNPINTWLIPTESDWNTLVTYLNGGVAPTDVLATGSLGVPVGGKMKDYVRDLNATCWEFPNIGAQNDANSSGWAGIAGGKRNDAGVFSGLGLNGTWWSANSSPAGVLGILSLATRRLIYWTDEVYRNIHSKNNGFSIRLVRPAVAGEIDGTTILGAYEGNDGKIYDGIVIGTQVWIVQNLDETEYNDASLITFTTPNATWNNAINTATPTSCYYDNNSQNANILQGSIDPITNACFEYPTFYLYQKCGGTELLLQSEPGATTTPGEIQKDENNICWEFIETINTNPTINVSINFTGNYFADNNTVYNDCEECNAIHTIYMSFDTKNC